MNNMPSVFQKEYVENLINRNIQFVRCMPDDKGIILFANNFMQVPFFVIVDDKLQIDVLFMISNNQNTKMIEWNIKYEDMVARFPNKPTLEWEIKTLNKENPEFNSNPFIVDDLLKAAQNLCGINEFNTEKHLIIGFEFFYENYDFQLEFIEQLEEFAKQLNFPYDKDFINVEKKLPINSTKPCFNEAFINEFIVTKCNILNRELREETRVSGCFQEGY